MKSPEQIHRELGYVEGLKKAIELIDNIRGDCAGYTVKEVLRDDILQEIHDTEKP